TGFWETADRVVGANGALIAEYDGFIRARETYKADQRAARRARAATELAKLHANDEHPNRSVAAPNHFRWSHGNSSPEHLRDEPDGSHSEGDEHEALELARRVAASDVSTETLSRLEGIVDELAIKYPKTPPRELLAPVRQHVSYVMQLLDARKTLDEHRRLLI